LDTKEIEVIKDRKAHKAIKVYVAVRDRLVRLAIKDRRDLAVTKAIKVYVVRKAL
jgi:hypothetical protein